MKPAPLSVPEIPALDPADGTSIRAAFRKAPQLKFGQSWAERPSRFLRKGTVRIGWQDDRLLYLADLDDRDLFTTATRRNQNLWQLGDVLEIFAGLHGKPGYLEYHTAPNGVILQLFWPGAEALVHVQSTKDIAPFKRTDRTSGARVFVRQGGWNVLGWISAGALGLPPGTNLAHQVLDLNFGRYDCGPDGKEPVLSSTSPLTKPAYHRRHEWRTIHLTGSLPATNPTGHAS